MRASAPDPAVIEWLWSEEGIAWFRQFYKGVGHQRGAFAEVKDDHQCLSHCTAGSNIHYPDNVIKIELDKYGMSGVPDSWHREWLSAQGITPPDIRHS